MNKDSWRFIVAGLVALLGSAAPLQSAPGDLLGYIPFHTVAPQDFAIDDDGDVWVTTFLDNEICHYDPQLQSLLGTIPYPEPSSYPTGIAFNPHRGTLLVTDALSGRITEVEKSGVATGAVVAPDFEPASFPPSIRGMAFDPGGNGAEGSLYFAEATAALVYEVALDGTRIRTIRHPDSPEGFPDKGVAPPLTDVDLIFDTAENLAGFYVTGGPARLTHIRRLDADGVYRGLSIPLRDSGGNVSGIARRLFRHPGTGQIVDGYVISVESNARFAVLEGGEPAFHELTNFHCETTGRTVHLTWTRHQVYDRIEVSQACDKIATLPGTAESWTGDLVGDGIFELSVVAIQGDKSTEPFTCGVVLGAGEVLQSADVGGEVPADIATDGEGVLLVTDARRHKVLLKALDFSTIGELSLSDIFAGDSDVITGIAFSTASRTLYICNATQSTIGRFDETGALLSTFTIDLPNLEEDPEADPDLGFVLGMTFDPAGDGGRGSLWIVEVDRDWVYEIGVAPEAEGKILRSFRHPFIAVEPPPQGTPFSISSGAVSLVAGGSSNELYLSGGSLRDVRITHLVRVEKDTGRAVPGSAIPLQGVRLAAGTASVAVESFIDKAQPRLVALSLAGSSSKLLDVSPGDDLPPVTFLRARQVGFADDVRLEFVLNGAYDRLEVERDCEVIASIPGDVESYVDRSVSAGLHEYAVRAFQGNRASDFARAPLRVGPGAVLQRAFLWPANLPQQLTRDPVDGGYAVVATYRDSGRNVYFYDSSLRYLETRLSQVPENWEIATLAIRAAQGAKEIDSIAWQQPVPIGQVNSQKFLLVRESFAGDLIAQREITLPRPTNGFVTFPTGLAWHAPSDTFYLLERNSKTFVQMSVDGAVLRTFPHPAPPFQNFVFNLGVSTSRKRGTLFITGSNRYDTRVTKAMEMTLDGALTGIEIPLGDLGITPVGISIEGDDLIVVGTGSFSELLRVKAFSQPSATFVRGDADGNGAVNLTDVIATLGHLFQSGPAPACEDAADADDSGTLNLTDAITTLRSLFQGAGPLPPPYPESGFDPTPDGLPCF